MINFLLACAGIIIFIGIIRVIFLPYRGFGNLIMEMLLLEFLGDMLEAIIEAFFSKD